MEGARYRICHLVSGDGWGGAETMISTLMAAQARDPTLEPSGLLLNEGRLARELREAGVPVRIIPEREHGFFSLLPRIARAIRSIEPHVVHTHRYKENLLAHIVSLRGGFQPVVTVHGYHPPPSFWRSLRPRTLRLLLACAARLAGAERVAVSGELRSALGLSPDSCHVVPNGIPLPKQVCRLESRIVDGEQLYTIGWVGRMVSVKGLDILIHAIALLRSRGVTCQLLLVGDGPERDRLAEQATRTGVSDRVRFVGFAEDTRPYWCEMDSFVLPSHHEGVPMALLEAMAHGVPVVAASVGGIPEIDAGSGAIRLVGSRNAGAWADAIQAVFTEKDVTREMIEAGRRIVQERYSVEAMLRCYNEIYRTVLA